MIAKILAVLSAVLLVGAVAVASLGPQDMSLGDALTALDRIHFAAVEHYVRTHLSAWLWDHPVMAMLVRPPWLPPAVAGVLFAGAALTNLTSPNAPNSRRRRS